MKKPISITSMASVSPLGTTEEEIWHAYRQERHYLKRTTDLPNPSFAGFLSPATREGIESIRRSHPKLEKVDDSVLYAIHASRAAVKKAGWSQGDDIGINIGSSRGATTLFENFHADFLQNGRVNTLASPSTTLGNISSWVAQDLRSSGPEISHSVTCSTALHAVLNGVAWINSEMTEKFLAGGSEAALTPFTFAQVQAMKIQANHTGEYPCQALNLSKTRNSMVLGEGAAVMCMEGGEKENALAIVRGMGFATERLEHALSISANGNAFQKSMRMAMKNTEPGDIDAVVMHAPGTIKGDLSEVNAVRTVFGSRLPAMTTNKWKIGHTFGASGALNLELAILMLQHQEFIPVPFLPGVQKPSSLKNILVNAVGFGGNAVSVLVSVPGSS